MGSSGKKDGFSLLEILLSLAFISAVFGFSIAVYENLPARNGLNLAGQALFDKLSRAETLARSGNEDSQWGVRIENDSIVLFKGNSYALRDQTFDEIYPLFNTTTSGTAEFVFNKLSGYPTATGSVSLISSTVMSSETWYINEKGIISR